MKRGLQHTRGASKPEIAFNFEQNIKPDTIELGMTIQDFLNNSKPDKTSSISQKPKMNRSANTLGVLKSVDQNQPLKKWSKINKSLGDLGYSSVKLRGGKVDIESVQSVMSDLLFELKDKQSLVITLSNEISRLSLEVTRFKKEQKKFKNFFNKKDLQDSKEIFKAFMNREARVSSNTDTNVLNLISFLSHEQSMPTEILNECMASNYHQALNNIQKFKSIMETVPKVEKFLNEVIREIVTDPSDRSDIEKTVISEIKNYKRNAKNSAEFKHKVCEALGLENNAAPKDIIYKCSIVAHFKRLFQVKEEEVQAIEDLFWFVHEIKQFLQDVRRTLDIPDTETISDLLYKILCHVHKSVLI